MEQEKLDEELETPESQTEDETEVEFSELTEADFYKEKSRREKAEKALIDAKRKLKEKEAASKISSWEVDVKSIIKEELEQEKFFDKNEDALAYKDKILEYKSKWLTLDEAYILASKSDREIDNNRAYSESSIAWRQTSTWEVALLSIKEFDRLNSSAQSEYMNTCKAKLGTVKFK